MDAVKSCLVACDGPAGVACVEVQLPPEATIADALTAARARLPAHSADWERGSTGIWGTLRPRTFHPADGDRVELYRALPEDPRVRRRESVRRDRLAGR